MTNKTEIVFLLDRSGSMAGLECDTMGGFNAMIKKQQQETEGEVLVSESFARQDFTRKGCAFDFQRL